MGWTEHDTIEKVDRSFAGGVFLHESTDCRDRILDVFDREVLEFDIFLCFHELDFEECDYTQCTEGGGCTVKQVLIFMR